MMTASHSALGALVDFQTRCQPLHFRQVPLPPLLSMDPVMDPTLGIFVGQTSSAYDANDIILILRALCSPRRIDVRSLKLHRNHNCAFAELNQSSIPLILQYHRRLYCDRDTVWIAPSLGDADWLTQQVKNALPLLPQGVKEAFPRKFIVLESSVSRTLHPQRCHPPASETTMPQRHERGSRGEPLVRSAPHSTSGMVSRPNPKLAVEKPKLQMLLKHLSASLPVRKENARLRYRLNTDLAMWGVCSNCMECETVPHTAVCASKCFICSVVVMPGSSVRWCPQCRGDTILCVGCA